MRISINGHETTCNENSTLKKILQDNDIPLLNIAVAINNSVISKTQWDTTVVQDGSDIMIIKAVQGG